MSLFECSQGLAATGPPLSEWQSSAAHADEGVGPTAMLLTPGAPPKTRVRAAWLRVRGSDHGPAGRRLQPCGADSNRRCRTPGPLAETWKGSGAPTGTELAHPRCRHTLGRTDSCRASKTPICSPPPRAARRDRIWRASLETVLRSSAFEQQSRADASNEARGAALHRRSDSEPRGLGTKRSPPDSRPRREHVPSCRANGPSQFSAAGNIGLRRRSHSARLCRRRWTPPDEHPWGRRSS